MFASHSPTRVAAAFVVVCALTYVFPAASDADETTFTLFETGQVRPLAQSPDGSLLFVANTPDARLEVFQVGPGSLTALGSVPVGLEPIAVAARSNSEVWVVNHLSDSISIVDVSTPAEPRVVRTLLVGDEPRDIVFAGPGGARAFVTTAHRGQNTPLQPTIVTELRTEGIGRADVWVFDATSLGTSLGGDPETIVTLFGDTPRALAVSPDGSTVYAAVFHSGNRTTTLNEGVVTNNGGLPPPFTNYAAVAAPDVGLIVKFDGSQWVDELDRDWSALVRFSLPDHDVFAIDATADPPAQLAGPSGFWPGVGTVLFNMVTNPVSGKVYVSNTEAFNEVRFEGAGTFSGSSVRGHLHESRITVLDGLNVLPRHLNKHIDYDSCCDPTPNAENTDSMAFPLSMAVTADGATLYVSAFGSNEIGILDTAALEDDSFVPDAADQVALSGGGPTGLVLDEARSQIYVLTRFDNSLSIVDTVSETEVAHVALFNPEPASVVNGRPFLYDASFTSSHGDSACASCHVFGDFDSLAWDLGDPDGDVLNNPGPFRLGPIGDPDYHPMKGPMTTQSLRGMANHGPMHWRGDRTGGNDSSSGQPNSGTFDEDAGFKKFNPAFVGLLGRDAQLATTEMQAFTDFVLQITYPPNPIRALDNSLTAEELAGQTFYFGPISDGLFDCNGCHVLDPAGNAGFGVLKPGFFGSDGRSSFENETQHFKIAHLRNMYQKVGMFGMASSPFFNGNDDFSHTGDQVRGFGFLHDGSTDTLFRFHGADVFNITDQQRRDVEAFVLAFDSNLAPIVGQQITRTDAGGAAVDARIALLRDRADAGECDLVVKGTVGGEARGWLYVGADTFTSDRDAEVDVSLATLEGFADTPGQETTFTCVPPFGGTRVALDRDEDGHFDRDELDAGSDPADPLSVPGGGGCGDGFVGPGEDCDDGGESATCDIDCTSTLCGDGTLNTTAGELCDDEGESAACDPDCTLVQCGDGTTNAAAGELCDDSGESATCDADCTLVQCGDGTTNAAAGELCDDAGESSTCDADCTLAQCGDGTSNTTAGEACDDGGESASCDTDCTLAQCGDGTSNATAGEGCDDGGESASCDADCTLAQCGDGTSNTTAGEACDDGGESASCDTDCTLAQCGDGTTNATAGEACDDGGESAVCDADCTTVQCGDGSINASAGEECEGGDLGGETCASLSLGAGTLACNPSCSYDTSACSVPPVCGNAVPEPGEQCDDGGESVTCDVDCTTVQCGDGTSNTTAGEACDDGGESASCDADCTTVQCGDGTTNATAGEACDDGGESASCDTDCTLVQCGDGTRNGTAGEVCDGSDLGGQSCVTLGLGFDGGVLACDGGCGFDTSGCTLPPACGDGNVDAGEQCDGVELAGQSCESLGFGGGVLACGVGCTFDTTACTPAPRVYNGRVLKLSRLTKPSGEQVVTVKSDDLDGVGAQFNPLTEPLTITLTGSQGTIWQATIFAGDPDWRLRGNKLKWKSKSSVHPQGLKTVIVGLPGGPFRLRAKAKGAVLAGGAGEAAVETTLAIDDLSWIGSLPCGTSGSGSAVKCR